MLSFALRRPTSRVLAHTLTRQTTRGVAAAVACSGPSPDDSNDDHDQPASGTMRDEFWRNVPRYEDVSAKTFLSHRWSLQNTVQGKAKVLVFLKSVLPEEVPYDKDGTRTQRKEELMKDIVDGAGVSNMSIRVTPYILSRINWKDPRNDPVFRQFLPLKSVMLPDHPKLTLDSLHEVADSPVPGLVHRYPDKALFLATDVCPTYCTYCTRAHAVGDNTGCLKKLSFKPSIHRFDAVFAYIEATTQLQDIVVSGGDCYSLQPEQLHAIGERLLRIPHIRRFRFASRGLAVAPVRLVDPNDRWADALMDISRKGREAGKSVAFHTHFNHPNEISWVTTAAAQRLFEAGVTMRNQTVLLRGVNDDVETMSALIRRLADNNISPYYVYLCDMVQNNEGMRTSLQTMLDLETQIRGSIAGFVMPQFVVDLPGGGGKRLASTYESYDRKTGISRFVAPAVTTASAGGRGKPEVFEYHDPIGTDGTALTALSDCQERGTSRA